MNDNINNPNHYQGANGLEDLKKAREKHGWLIEEMEHEG